MAPLARHLAIHIQLPEGGIAWCRCHMDLQEKLSANG
jgi:hypothetical protein